MSSQKPMKSNKKQSHHKPQVQLKVRALLSLFSCKYYQNAVEGEKRNKVRRTRWSASLCNLRESSNSKAPEISKISPSASSNNSSSLKSSDEVNEAFTTSFSSKLSASMAPSSSSSSSSSSSLGGSFRGMDLRRLSCCNECNVVTDPVTGISRVVSLRTNVFPCAQCEEIFSNSDSLEHHQAVKHAVSELGLEDNSRNIVEIIFKSSWLKKQAPMYNINRILKVHHTQSTISCFEAYRDSIKNKANKLVKKHPRCIADGNELLRFYCTTFSCSLGCNGSSSLCLSNIPNCNVCSIIRDGFKLDELSRIRTMETSGRAHDVAQVSSECKERAMLVCRVIAGRVSKNQEGVVEECDSVGGDVGVLSSLDELFVFDPKAILPCFVVIYESLKWDDDC